VKGLEYDADVTDKNSKKRFQLSEVGVYTVKNGKIDSFSIYFDSSPFPK